MGGDIEGCASMLLDYIKQAKQAMLYWVSISLLCVIFSQMLLDHMNKLSDALRHVNTEKKELEVRLRHELCSEFSKQLIEVEADWR